MRAAGFAQDAVRAVGDRRSRAGLAANRQPARSASPLPPACWTMLAPYVADAPPAHPATRPRWNSRSNGLVASRERTLRLRRNANDSQVALAILLGRSANG
ncbi:hypothetical protein ACU4GD_10730 [Cupriavidus basilensis]